MMIYELGDIDEAEIAAWCRDNLGSSELVDPELTTCPAYGGNGWMLHDERSSPWGPGGWVITVNDDAPTHIKIACRMRWS